MKSFVAFLLTLFFVQTALAEGGLVTKTTANGYDRKDFCGNGAKKNIDMLNEKSKDGIKKVIDLQTNINELNARKNLIDGMLKLRDQFVASARSLSSSKEFINKDKEKKLNDFKILLRSSLTLSAVSMIAKNKQNVAVSGSITELCSVSENKENNLCKYVNKKIVTSPGLSSEIKNLNATLANVNQALALIPKPEETKKELEAIYNTIPAPIGPEKIISHFNSSPELSAALSNNDNLKSINECLGDNPKSCEKLISETNRGNLKEILTSQMSEIHKDFTKNKIDVFFDNYDKRDRSKKELIDNGIQETSKIAIDSIEKDQKDRKLQLLGISDEEFNHYKDVCGKQNFNSDECKKESSKIITYFEYESKNLDSEIKKNMQDLENLSANNSELEINEKMKQYVAKKYLRTCSHATEDDLPMSYSACLGLNDNSSNLIGDKSEIGLLNSKLSSIIGRLKLQGTYTNKQGELGTFSKDELKDYESYCLNTNAKKIYSDICEDIMKESNALANQKESKEWAEYSKKYWIDYDPNSKAGYKVTEKTNNGVIFAKGLAQSIYSVYPTWLANYQLQGQIDLLTAQAINQKQMNYMYSPDSPWMNYFYFQGAYFPTYNYSFTASTSGFNFSN